MDQPGGDSAALDFHRYRLRRLRQEQAEVNADRAQCERCGCQWFELRPRPNDPAVAVTMTTAGHIDGWTGEPHCLECGQSLAFRHD